MKAKLTLKIYDTDSVQIIRVGNEVADGHVTGNFHDFFIVPSEFEASLEVADKEGNVIFEDEEFELTPTYSIPSLIDGLQNQNTDELDEEDYAKRENYVKRIKFSPSTPSEYKREWERMKMKEEDEESFVINLLKFALDDNKKCYAEVGDCSDYDSICLEYEIELPDDEFDPDSLDFFNVDPDPETRSLIWNVFTDDVIFLDAIIYDRVIYGALPDDEKYEPNSSLSGFDPETLENLD